MATWKDGPRYAPAARPAGFAEPAEALSLAPAPVPPALPPAPPMPPDGFQPTGQGKPLEAIVPIIKDARDPHQAFSTVASLMTSGDATSTVAVNAPAGSSGRVPYEPFRIIPATPTAASWAPPDASMVPAKPIYPVSPRDCIQAAYPPLLIVMVVSAIVATVNVWLPLIVLIAAPFLLATRVRFRVKQLQATCSIILGILGVVFFIQMFMYSLSYNFAVTLDLWVPVACLALPGAAILLQWLGIRNGERPNTTS
ncbi:MAG: hypothetical protein FWD55_04895 [Propionibacteriaceae bacterium]|nr:hypothetical protein [Propionibacteriaceae bacterium]